MEKYTGQSVTENLKSNDRSERVRFILLVIAFIALSIVTQQEDKKTLSEENRMSQMTERQLNEYPPESDHLRKGDSSVVVLRQTR